MLLCEFDDLRVSAIVVVSDQLKSDYEQGKIPSDFSVDDLLDYFQDNNIMLDRTDLYDMIKVPPLKSVITNIQGDKVVFKGQDSSVGSTDPNDSKKTVATMAKHALKK